jgi:hypothetical protein
MNLWCRSKVVELSILTVKLPLEESFSIKFPKRKFEQFCRYDGIPFELH